MRFILFFLTILLFMAQGVKAEELTVEQAFASLGVERTAFDPAQSRIKDTDRIYLSTLFAVADEAMLAKYKVLQQFYYNSNTSSLKAYNETIDSLLSAFHQIPTPEQLEYVEATIIGAIREQQSFFNQWGNKKGTPAFDDLKKTYGNAPLVLSSHQKLLDAYGELMNIYAYESGHNKKSFYSHLCGLDLI